MKILFLINSIRISGAEKLMIGISERLKRGGDEVYLFPLITPFDESYLKALPDQGFHPDIWMPWYILRFDWFFWKLNGLFTALFNWPVRKNILQNFISRKCRQVGIDLIVSNSYDTDLLVTTIHRKTNIPYVIVDHGSYSSFAIEKRSFDDTAVKGCVEIVGVSQWTVNNLKLLFPQVKTRLIYNGHTALRRGAQHVSTFTSQDLAESFVFCMHGRDAEQKGWDVAIESFTILKAKGYKVKLILLTAGPYIESLRVKYPADPDIIFGGFVYDLANVFDMVDAGLVLSKRYETFGLSVLDYFSSGIPVIASKVGGLPEVVEYESRRGGFLVATDDHGAPVVAEIVKRMEDLINDHNTYEQFSRNGTLIAEKFSIDRCESEYREMFHSIIKS